MQNLKEQLAAKENAELTFKPKLNSQYNLTTSYTPLMDRILETEVRRRVEAKNLRDVQLQKELSHVTFSPRISAYAASIQHDAPFHARLYEDSKERGHRLQAMKGRREEELDRAANHHAPAVSFLSPVQEAKLKKGQLNPKAVFGVNPGSKEFSDATFRARFPEMAEKRVQEGASNVFDSLYGDSFTRAQHREIEMAEEVCASLHVYIGDKSVFHFEP